ncbi:hypothetical protein NW805_07145 [Synechococcus sp. W60.1]
MQREKQDTWPIGLDRQPTGVDEAAFIAANATVNYPTLTASQYGAGFQ